MLNTLTPPPGLIEQFGPTGAAVFGAVAFVVMLWKYLDKLRASDAIRMDDQLRVVNEIAKTNKETAALQNETAKTMMLTLDRATSLVRELEDHLPKGAN